MADVTNKESTERILDYQLSSGARPWWMHAVVAVYLAIVSCLFMLPYWMEMDWIPYLIFLAVFLVCGGALFVIPVNVARRRPIRRRAIWYPIIGSGLLAGALVFAGCVAFGEYKKAEEDSVLKLIIVAAVAVWVLWSVVLIPLAFSVGPGAIGMRLHRLLLAGSFLELVIAVPCHIVVRRRNECCAGIVTGMAICFGVAVAFIAFGPTVFLLYYRRFKKISGT